MKQFLCSLFKAILPRRFYASHCTQSYVGWVELELDRKTKFVEFEPNGEALWENVQRTIRDFLLNEFQTGALAGNKPELAFFVRCDRTTMTQEDIDNGRLICVVGIAPVKPAEFVIIRIGQWTRRTEPDP
jgi:phage tail sheath protein FI